jgi:HSP20 family molecular chaperone IbpA
MKDFFRKPKKQIIEELTNTLQVGKNLSGIRINERNGQLIGNEHFILNNETNFNDFYDIIVDIKSVKDICKGWNIKMSEKAEKEYEELKKGKVIKIGVIGNANKGKSFLLSKISQINLPVGTNIRTEGLSIKYPELEKFQNRRIVLLDSAGLETPVLNEEEKDEKDLFKEKSRDKLITELFLQNYIINNSDILIIVVGILSYSEQKLLNKIKLQLKNSKLRKSLFVIHNLMTFTKMSQVNEYIETILKKSITFKLEEGHKISTSVEDIKGLYFVEKNDDKDPDFQIYHYMMANEGSEAGNYLNDFTRDQLNKFFIVTIDKPFDIIETLKERFVDMSKEMFEKTDEILLENFDNTDNKLIKLNKPNNITLKKCLIDELGFSNLRTNGFMPLYNYYRKGDKLIVRLEAPGNCTLQSSLENIGEYVTIRIKGVKKKDKEPEDVKDNIYTNREIGDFSLDIGLKASEYILKSEDPKIIAKNGVFVIEYTIEENKKKVTEYKQNEEDEI